MGKADIVAIEVGFAGDPGLDLAQVADHLWAALAAKGPAGQPAWDGPELVHLRLPGYRISLGWLRLASGRFRFVASALPLGGGRPGTGLEIVRAMARQAGRLPGAEAEIWHTLSAPLDLFSLQALAPPRAQSAPEEPVDLPAVLGLTRPARELAREPARRGSARDAQVVPRSAA